MNHRHHHQISSTSSREGFAATTDLENALPTSFQQQLNTGPIKPNQAAGGNSATNNTQQILKKGLDVGSQKRKALVDITNTQGKGIQQNNLQPAKKKVKSNPIQVFDDQQISQQPKQAPLQNKPKNLLSTHKKMSSSSSSIMSNMIRPQLKFSFNDTEIEYCPEPEVLIEHPTPIFTEFDFQTGKAEDIFVTLSDEKMKQFTKPPISKQGTSFSFDVFDSITSTTPSSPSPQPLTPTSFGLETYEHANVGQTLILNSVIDDIFNFEVSIDFDE